MAFNTGNPPGSSDFRDLSDNAVNFDKYSSGLDPTYLDRFGRLKLSISGMNEQFNNAQEGRASQFEAVLAGIGFVWLGDYGAGLTFTTRQQYTVRGGLAYTVANDTTLPFTLTGTWATDQLKLKLVNSDQVLRSDLASSDPDKGAALVYGLTRTVTSVAALRATPGRANGERVQLSNYVAGDGKGAGRYLTWVAASSLADDGGMRIAAPGGVWVGDLLPGAIVDAAFYGLPSADKVFTFTQISAMEAYMFQSQGLVHLSFGPGVYDVGIENMPFRNPTVPPTNFKDYKGSCIYGTPTTVFKTTSVDGADVFQLNAVAGLSILGYPKVTATISGTTVAGSNGVSLTFGGRDITLEIDCYDLPFLDKGYADGGKAWTLQTGTGNVLGYSNIRISGSAYNVAYGFGIDAEYDNAVAHPFSGIELDIYVEDAYRAYVIGLSAPTTAPARPLMLGVSGKMRAKNCQQYVVESRSVGTSMEFEVFGDKVKADLIKLASDPSVLVGDIKASKFLHHKLHGSVNTVDTLLSIGGISMGGGVSGATSNISLLFDVTAVAATNKVVVTDFGGNAATNCDISLYGNLAFTGYEDLLSKGGNSLKLNGLEIKPVVYPGDSSVVGTSATYFTAIFDVALTATRSVIFNTNARKGDVIRVVRTAAGAGVLSVGGLRNIAAGTWIDATYSGTAWGITASGAV